MQRNILIPLTLFMTDQCNGDDKVNEFHKSGAQYNASLQISIHVFENE